MEVTSVCSSTDCEAVASSSPVSLLPRSGDISIALKVALSWETSWLCALESRERLASMVCVLKGPRLALLLLLTLGRRCRCRALG